MLRGVLRSLCDTLTASSSASSLRDKPSPSSVFSWLMFSLCTSLPGFYDDVKVMDPQEEELYRGLHFPLEDFKVRTGDIMLKTSWGQEIMKR